MRADNARRLENLETNAKVIENFSTAPGMGPPTTQIKVRIMLFLDFQKEIHLAVSKLNAPH